jgi:hypothetical protein
MAQNVLPPSGLVGETTGAMTFIHLTEVGASMGCTGSWDKQRFLNGVKTEYGFPVPVINAAGGNKYWSLVA